jgi:poly-gamma-glutamate synthesis protein (capsule biosynthesis protein)
MQSNGKRLSIALTGDSFIATRISAFTEPLFLKLVEIIRSADVRFTNCEVLINDFKGYPAVQSGGTYAGNESYIADELKWMGFNIVSRANNHATDYREIGLIETSKNLDRVGIVHAGVGMNLGEAREPKYLETSKGRVALISAATSFPTEARAGEARPDMQGRPGLNPLRYTITIEVTEEIFKNLVIIAKMMGIEVKEDAEEIRILGQKFKKSTKIEVKYEVNKRDLEGNIKAIRNARRMADYVLFSLHDHERGKSIFEPQQFVEDFARKCIDEGVDVFIGHGPHVLRGIEIYKKKPIFYSLGNFIFQNDLIRKQPADLYERYGLNWDSTTADLYDARERGSPETAFMGFKWFTDKEEYWESILAYVTFNDGNLEEIKLYPVDLCRERNRANRGKPILATGAKANKILETVAKLSEKYNTKITIKNGVGFVEL